MSQAIPERAPAKPWKILVVDDEVHILQTLRYNLEKNGYQVCTAGDGRQALSVLELEKPDLCVLDIMLPELDGTEVCREIRKRSNMPVLMLSAKDQEIDKVLLLEIGADDYITKPFSIYELLARVKAHLRRLGNATRAAQELTVLNGGDIELDTARQRVTKAGNVVELAPKEFSLLHVLLENRGRVVTRQTLLDRVWGYDFYGDQQTVNVHVRWLREKIEDDPNDPQHIITVRSRGYLFRE
jgi:DNA-binding response OmpR family regulator